jgi:C-terminal processing protease CtpA/Prc
MKISAASLLLALLLGVSHTASAQLTVDQRVHDFQNLAALYAKRYAPADWKRRSFGFDLFDIKPWLERVRAAKDDLEFFEIQAEYVANLNDTHTGFQMTSSFRANIGMTVDIYDGKVLIDSINRGTLPVATFPFQIGDEIVSVDSVSAEDWIKRISTWRRYGNPVTTRRLAAAQITFRAQPTFPRAIEIGDSATVVIRRMSGSLETYTIPWVKAGLPVTTVGPVPSPRTLVSAEHFLGAKSSLPESLDDLHNYELPAHDMARTYVLGIGSAIPIFRAGLPANFVQRLRGVAPEFLFSGTYTSGGFTIGYLRIPSFGPPATAVAELRAEIDYLQRNTDGLVVDVMRNPGGGCFMLDAAAALTPYPFYFFGEEIRATQDRLNGMQSQLEIARLTRAPQSVIDTLQTRVDKMKAALIANRGMTEPLAACSQSGQTTPPTMNNNAPGAAPYTKPIIILIDEFSISAADIFPSMMQDNERALLVGMRSSGGGGSVSGWPTGLYSESLSANTNTLVVRKNPIVTPDFPAAPYVEHIGARPDVSLDYMTRENLLNGGRAFVDRFTEVLVREIQIQERETPFTIASRGAVTHVTPGASGQTLVGYGRIKADFDNAPPSGMAIFGFRQNNVLVSETSVPATPAILSGRIYAEIDATVNTGVAIANPNPVAATISFHFTGPNGNFGNGTTTIAANGHTVRFLDQAPFNGTRPMTGAFTFTSNVPVAVTGLRGFTNERGEFLTSALPVAELSSTPLTGVAVFPHFADGNGWTTQIALVNPTDVALTGTLQFFSQAGTPLSVTLESQTGSTFSYSIPARGSQKLRTSGSGSALQAGSVRILPAGTTARPSGVAIFSFRKDGVTVAHAGVPASASGSAFRVYAEASGNFDQSAVGSIQTGLAISNLLLLPTTVTLELTRPDGSSTGLTGSIVVPANGQVSTFLNQVPGFASLPVPLQGVLRVSSASPVAVTGLRGRYNERTDFLITTTPPSNEAASTNAALFFPHFAEAGGYTTQFVLFSGSTQQSSGALRLFSQSGEPLSLTLR